MDQETIDALLREHKSAVKENTRLPDPTRLMVEILQARNVDFEIVLRVSGAQSTGGGVLNPTCAIVIVVDGKAVVLNEWFPLTSDEYAKLGPFAEPHWKRYVERIEEKCGPGCAVTFREHLPWKYNDWMRNSVRLSIFDCRRVA